MPGPKTNEREGTRAVLRHTRVSAYKVREVLNLIRNKPVAQAKDILHFCERDAAILVEKLLDSAIANAGHNDQLEAEELYVSACFADEGTTIKRWRPRARGRATRIRKRTCHITVIVSRLPDADLVRLYARREAEQAARRSRRVAGARKADATATSTPGGGSGGPGRGIRSRVRPTRRTTEAAPSGDAGEAAADHSGHGHDGHDHDGHDHDHDHEDTTTEVTAAVSTPKQASGAAAEAPPETAPATAPEEEGE